MTQTTHTESVDASELRETREPVHILDLPGGTEFVYADPEDCRTERNADKVHQVGINGYLGEKTMNSIDVQLAESEKEPEKGNYGNALHYGSTHGLHPRAFENDPDPDDPAQKTVYVIPVGEDEDVGTHTCEDCGQTFNLYVDLSEHDCEPVGEDSDDADEDDESEGDDHTNQCADCNDSFSTWDEFDEHDCTPTCHHCGATYEDLDDPESDTAQFAIEDHQRTCDERPASADQPIRDIEGGWREEKREKERIDQWMRKLEREGVY